MSQNKPIETRALAELELRTKGRRLEGYAAVFNQRARIADFEEMIAPGAFSVSLADGSDKLALVDHNPQHLLGRTRNNSLRLTEDLRGLHFDVSLPKTTLADDILALAEAGSLGGASFQFVKMRDAWAGSVRTLQQVALVEVSIVRAFPAYPQTSVSARMADLRPDDLNRRRLRLLELGAGQ